MGKTQILSTYTVYHIMGGWLLSGSRPIALDGRYRAALLADGFCEWLVVPAPDAYAGALKDYLWVGRCLGASPLICSNAFFGWPIWPLENEHGEA